MRCPKCGFISFDYLDTCLKCNKDIKETAEKIHGSVYNVAAPTFLKFTREDEDAAELDEAFLEEGDALGDEEIRDPDLDILLDEGEAIEPDDDIEFSLGDDEDEGQATEPVAEEDDGIDFQFGDFDEDADLGDDDAFAAGAADESVSMNLPDELSDMTDLGPPSPERPVAASPAAAEEDFDFELSLDDDESDLGGGDITDDVDLADLSLGDIDYTEEAPAAEPPKPVAAKKIDLDDDFDFELDLGDLKLDDDENL